MADNVEVKLGANTAPATTGIASAATSIQGSLDKVNTSLQQMGAQAQAQSQKTTESLNKLSGTAREVAGALAATFGVRASINAYIETEEQVRKLEIAFGMSAEAATNFNVRLQLAGVSAEAYIAMGLRVAKSVATQGDEFERLKIKTKDASGAFLPMDEILENVYKRMQDFKAGTDQNEFALATVGRSAKDFAGEMERMSRTQERANEVIKNFGIEMGPERQAEIERYRMEVNAFRIGISEVAGRIGEALLPILERLATWFVGEGKSSMDIIENALKSIATIVVIVSTVFATVGRQIGITVGAIVTQIQLWGQALYQLMTLDWNGLGNTVKQVFNNIAEYADSSMQNMVGSAKKAIAEIEALWAGNGSQQGMHDRGVGSGVLPGSGKENFTTKPKKGGAGSDGRLAAWRDELVQMQEAEGYFHEFSKAQEAEFWVAKLALVTGYGKQDVKLRQELNHLIFNDRKAAANEELQAELAKYQRLITAATENKDQQIALAVERTALIAATFGTESKQYEQVLDQELRLREQWVRKENEIMKLRTKMDEARSTHEITMEQLNLDQQYALRQVNLQQKLSAETGFENRLYQMKLAALQAEAAALQAGTKARIEVDAQIEALEMAHQERLTVIANEAERDRMQYAVAMQQALENGFASLLNDLTSGTKKWKDAFLDAAKQIERAITDLVAKKLAAQLFGAGTGGGDLFGSLAKMLFGGGGGGGFGGGAPDFALGGAGDVIPSFDVGTPYVPRDTLALVHQGERIVPAAQNRVGGGGVMSVHNNFHISGPVDSRTQDQIALAAARGTQRGAYRIG